MSTYWDFHCRDHDVLADIDGARNDHGKDILVQVLQFREHVDLFVALSDLLAEMGGHYPSVALSFLSEHRSCKVWVRNEYGDDA